MEDAANHRELRDQPFGLGEWLVEPMYDRVVSPRASNRVRPRAMDVLVDLRIQAPRVVAADELIDRFWAHNYVGDAAVHHIVAELRKALDDDSREPRYIETIPKRGYRLIEPARPVDVGHGDHAPCEARAGSFECSKYSLAVLPFDTICSDPCGDHFAQGLHDEIISRLSRSPAFEVTSRTSVKRFGGLRDRSLPNIASMLGVSYVLEGAVRLLDRRVRVSLRLIDAKSDLQLWTKTYDAILGDVFEVQSEIAEDVARELDLALPGCRTKAKRPGRRT